MRNKFKSVIIVVILFINLLNSALAQQTKSSYNIVVGRDGFSAYGGKNYISIQIYLNNNSNDTLYYRGSDCYNLLFSIKSNPYFHLARDICNQNKFFKTALAPHRAQKMEFYLTLDKTPDRDISIIINMGLYKWVSGKAKQKKELLSGLTILHYNSNHQAYWPKGESEILDKKERYVLPNKDIYLLTDIDRKLYTLTVEKTKISLPRDTNITIAKNNKTKKAKVITIPIIVHNNSNDTLRFYSMTCSWYTFFSTNTIGIGVTGWDCFKNIIEFVAVAPHNAYKRNLNIVYYSNIKQGSRYRISMSLLKAPSNIKRTWDFWPEEYVRFNKIWSNEITIQ